MWVWKLWASSCFCEDGLPKKPLRGCLIFYSLRGSNDFCEFAFVFCEFDLSQNYLRGLNTLKSLRVSILASIGSPLVSCEDEILARMVSFLARMKSLRGWNFLRGWLVFARMVSCEDGFKILLVSNFFYFSKFRLLGKFALVIELDNQPSSFIEWGF